MPHLRAADSHGPVAICGGGPVGLFAALTLARNGISSLVIEADSGVCEGSRAICISRRSLQILDRVGASGRFLQRGLPWQSGRTYLGTTPIFDLKMPHTSSDRFPPFINLQQYLVEEFLTEACRATGLVEIRLNTRVTAVDNSETGVAVYIAGPHVSERIESAWLIACDGARSSVRDMLGLKLQGDSFDSRYLIADIEMDCEWPTERKVWFNPTSNPNSTVIMHRQPDNVWRIDYQLLRDQDSEAELEEGNIRRRIDAHLKFVGLNCSWRLLWKSLYQARTLSLRNYVHERVIFAGDAAHLVPIFGVRGLNSGLDDAMNLGWKLPYVLRGLASPRLLATYDRERRDAYQENISNAIKTTWFMSPPTDGFIIARDAILELATVNPQFRQLIDPRQSSFHRYRSEAILENPDCAYIGLPLSEVSLADGSNVHQWLGPEFSTIAVSPNAGAVETRHEEIDGVSVRHVTVPQSWLSGELDLRPGQLIFVRPDSYVSAFRHEGEASRTRDIIAGCLAGTRVAREGTHAG